MPTYSRKVIGIVVGVALVVGGSIWLYRGGEFPKFKDLKFQYLKIVGRGGWVSDQNGENGEDGGEEGFLFNVHPGGAFSFRYPADFHTETFPNGKTGDVVLISRAGGLQAIQIFVVPFDEDGPITAARIKQDLPNKRVENSQEVLIGAAKDVKALLFSSENPEIGQTREVWFVNDGYLYEVMTQPDAEQFMGKILDTLEF